MTSIVDILSRHGIAYKLPPHRNVRRGWVGIDCPKCSPHHGKFRLGFEIGSLRAHCWVCGSFYTPDILALLLRKSKDEIHELIGDLPRSKHSEYFEAVPTGIYKPPSNVGAFEFAHEHYLRSRGFVPEEVAREWGVGGIGIASRLQWRLFIPIFDRFGRKVSWTTRSLAKDATVRYWSASPEEESVPHKSLLYGAHKARHTVVVLEGPVDVWTIGPGAVATLGVGFSTEQKSLIGQYPRRVVCFDAEPDAQRRAGELCEDLCLLPGVTENVVLESGKDPNSCDKSEIQELRQRYFPEYFLQ